MSLLATRLHETAADPRGLGVSFARGVATRDEAGKRHAPDEPRYSVRRRGVTSGVEWTERLNFGPGTVRGPWAGRTLAGEDRVVVTQNSVSTLRLYDPTDWSVAATRPLLRSDSNTLQEDLLAGLPNQQADRAYAPIGLVGIDGTWLAYCSVLRDTASNPAARNWTAEGSAVLVSQDGFASWLFAGVAGGVDGRWPLIANTLGENRGALWSFRSFYPETLDAQGRMLTGWIAPVDYQNDDKLGGQCVLYRLSRASADQHYTISTGRVVYQLETPSGTHFHTAGVVVGEDHLDIMVMLGDEMANNNVRRLRVPKADWQTAPIVEQLDFHGARGATPPQIGFQGVGMFAHPYGLLAGTDNQGALVVGFDAPESMTDRATPRGYYGGFCSQQGENALKRQIALHSHLASPERKRGYAFGVGTGDGLPGSTRVLYSEDGETFAAIRDGGANDVAVTGRDVVISTTDGRVLSTPRPVVRSVKPLLIGRGGANLVDRNDQPAPVSGAVTEFTRLNRNADGTITHPDTGQPMPAPGDSAAYLVDCLAAPMPFQAGRFLVGLADPRSGQPFVARTWVYNLDAQSAAMAITMGSTPSAAIAWHRTEVVPVGEWTPLQHYRAASANANDLWCQVRWSPNNLAATRFLVVAEQFCGGLTGDTMTLAPGYPLDKGVTGADERCDLYGLPTAVGGAWSLGVTGGALRGGYDYYVNPTVDHPLLSLLGDATLDVWLRNGSLVLSDGTTDATLSGAELYPDDTFRVAVSHSASGATLWWSRAHGDWRSATLGGTFAAPTSLRLSADSTGLLTNSLEWFSAWAHAGETVAGELAARFSRADYNPRHRRDAGLFTEELSA